MIWRGEKSCPNYPVASCYTDCYPGSSINWYPHKITQKIMDSKFPFSVFHIRYSVTDLLSHRTCKHILLLLFKTVNKTQKSTHSIFLVQRLLMQRLLAKLVAAVHYTNFWQQLLRDILLHTSYSIQVQALPFCCHN
jgi:hypothetical protein